MYLNCHTSLSFKYGTLSCEQLFAEARRCGVQKLGLTEINNTASLIEMLRICEQNRAGSSWLKAHDKEAHHLEIVPGVEFRQGSKMLYVALARNNKGFAELNRFLSRHNRNGTHIPARAPAFDNVYVIYPYYSVEADSLRAFEFLGVGAKDLVRLTRHAPYHQHRQKFVALQPVTFASKRDFNIHRLLRAIDTNTLLSKLAPAEQAEADEIMLEEISIRDLYQSFPGIIQNTDTLLADCAFEFNMAEDKNKRSIKGDSESDLAFLTQEAFTGFEKRYSAGQDALKERLHRELYVIGRKNFCAYYLIAYDLIRFANSNGFPFVGRGSGANSMVAYCLGITNVDPVELDLYFERFLNEERSSPPDFDIDFSWDHRDAIYDYLFKTYGQDHVCLLGTHVTFQKRSLLRELGKVFGLPKDEIDELVANPAAMEHRDHITELICRYAELMNDLPSNLSIHAGGVLITEKPVHEYTAIDLPPKGYPVSHFEMHAAEDFGITKFDILSQRGLGHLREAVAIVKKNRGLDVDINDIRSFKEDPKIRNLLRNGRTMGCFYVESPAMRMLLGKLQCEDYLTLVAASSIIRPGVASSGMMRTYIERFHLKKKGGTYQSIHPRMDELMAETYGVMVYQEDVIKVAHYFAGLTLTEADVLRRGMSGKYRSRFEFQRVKDKFFANCRQKGYDEHVVQRVWFEIESFSGYSFAKGHSASYAVESYQSLYLKAHFPLEFMVGVINNFGGFYKSEFYFHEARMNGGVIEAPCVNKGEHLTRLEGNCVIIGFIHVKGLEKSIATGIAVERSHRGEFISMEDFLYRMKAGLEQIRILIRIGAFRFTGKTKQRLLWEAMLFFSHARTRSPSAQLFDTEPLSFPLPHLERRPIEDAFDEIELLGFSLCDPFLLLATDEHGSVTARELMSNVGKHVHLVGYMVTVKDTYTKAKQTMNFGTFYDRRGEVFDTVHFPDVAKRFPLRGRGFYSIKGIVIEEFGVPAIQVTWLDKLPLINKRADEFMRENNYELKTQRLADQ